jgi:hypothetical protein
MRDKRSEFSDRRHKYDMPRDPFKDSNGATIKECRRKITDRRTDDTTRFSNKRGRLFENYTEYVTR